MNKNFKAKYLLVIVFILFVGFIIVSAKDIEVEIKDNGVNADIDVELGGVNGDDREITVLINDIHAGRRITGMKYCLDSAGCNEASNWHSVSDYNARNVISSYQNSEGNDDMVFRLTLPNEDYTLDVTYTDFEPMDISYARYKTDEELTEEQETTEYRMEDTSRYKDEYTPLVTGYIGGDIVLPEDCTSGGCMLKITLSDENYNLYKARLDAANETAEQHDKKKILEVGGFQDHLEFENLNGNTVEYRKESNGNLYIENGEGTKSVYIYISRYFYQNNRADFSLGENKNRLLHENYLGLKVEVDKKYFDDGNDYGFLSFTESNSYKRTMTMFYGAQYFRAEVDALISPRADSTPGVGTLKHVYNKIVSSDTTNYPITDKGDGKYNVGITSFYEQEYRVPLVLKNGDTTVQNITLYLQRFAFRGNGGNVVLVDSNGINCRRTDQSPVCTTSDNTYVSTSYRGRVDTFYANDDTTSINTVKIFNGDIAGQPILRLDTFDNRLVYRRNESFNPWAVAIYYRDDTVVSTKSFNLGEMVKLDGYSTDPIDNDLVNKDEGDSDNCYEISNDSPATCAKGIEYPVTGYDKANYEYFGHGMGYEIPINKIKFFDEDVYKKYQIDIPLKLASKTFILENGITRIALFLTNGELKPDDSNFPELTYGVGEGAIFTIDNRTWD